MPSARNLILLLLTLTIHANISTAQPLSIGQLQDELINYCGYLIANATNPITPERVASLEAEFDSAQVGMQPTKATTTQLETRRIAIPQGVDYYHLVDNDDQLLLLPARNDTAYNSFLRQIRQVSGSGWYSGYSPQLDSWLYASIDEGERSSITFFVKTGIGLVLYNSELPFSIRGETDAIPTPKQSTLIAAYDRLRKRLDILTATFVPKAANPFLQDTALRMSAAERVRGLFDFWRAVEYNFAFFDQVPGLDWHQQLDSLLPEVAVAQSDYTYYRTLQGLCARLKDGHTNVYMPPGLRANRAAPPVELAEIGGQPTVINVDSSLLASLPLGTVILRVDGIDAKSYRRDSILPYISQSAVHTLLQQGTRDLLKGINKTAVRVGVRLPSGKVASVDLYRNGERYSNMVLPPQRSHASFRLLDNDIAYLNVHTFAREDVIAFAESKLDSIRAARALVIDLRQNIGGDGRLAYRLLRHFADRPLVGSTWQTPQRRSAYRVWEQYATDTTDRYSPAERLANQDPAAHWYYGTPDTIAAAANPITLPVIVLIGGKTVSAAEDFLVAADGLPHFRTVGNSTYGSTGQPLFIDLPRGGRARICTKKDTYPDGREFVGYGIRPDVSVPLTLKDYTTDYDGPLERALQLLRE